MHRIMVAGIGTEAGKTVAAAILTSLLRGSYWKPIECGDPQQSDSAIVRKLLKEDGLTIHPPAYSFANPLSPHHAARLAMRPIDLSTIVLPQLKEALVIEGVGGVMVPLTLEFLSLDLFTRWECRWIVVSRHYLGSINHTLLTLEILKQRAIPLLGLIFNGLPNRDTEQAILQQSKVPCLGRLLPEATIDNTTIRRYAALWRTQVEESLHS